MSDTPETDAAVAASGGDWSPVLRAVAQRLERERDEAREIAHDLAVIASHCLGSHSFSLSRKNCRHFETLAIHTTLQKVK